MNKIQELKYLKNFVESIKQDSSMYSNLMYDFLINLHSQTPVPREPKEMFAVNMTEDQYDELFFNIIKHMNNGKISREYVSFKRDIGFNIDPSKLYTINELIDYAKYTGIDLTNIAYGKSEFNDKYIPYVREYLFEMMMIWSYCYKYSYNNQGLFSMNRYSNISKNIWDLYALDELSQQKVMANYKKLNSHLGVYNFEYPIQDYDDAISRYSLENIKAINSYIVASILMKDLLKDDYAFNHKFEELAKTDNMNYNSVMNVLGMNYIKHNDIIKSLRFTRDDINGRKIN